MQFRVGEGPPGGGWRPEADETGRPSAWAGPGNRTCEPLTRRSRPQIHSYGRLISRLQHVTWRSYSGLLAAGWQCRTANSNCRLQQPSSPGHG
jgi:hypothetical protein